MHKNEVLELNDMYKRIENLCKQNGINVTQMCKESGVARAPLTELKMGRTAILSARNADKIASYFNVSVGYLLGKEDTKKTPTQEGERDALKERVFAALESAEPAIREAALRLLGVQE